MSCQKLQVNPMQIQYVTTNKGSVNRDTRHQALNAELLQNVKSGKIPNE